MGLESLDITVVMMMMLELSVQVKVYDTHPLSDLVANKSLCLCFKMLL